MGNDRASILQGYSEAFSGNHQSLQISSQLVNWVLKDYNNECDRGFIHLQVVLTCLANKFILFFSTQSDSKCYLESKFGKIL